jgi:acyl carrier protein
MSRKEKIIQAVYQAIDEINETLPEGGKAEKSMETTMVGSASALDSLALINLIIAVEQKIEEGLGITVTLADENAASSEHGPMRNVQVLVEHIDSLLEGKCDA